VRKGVQPSDWLHCLLGRKPRMVAVVALANEMARIVGAIMTREAAIAMSTLPPRNGKSSPGQKRKDPTRMESRINKLFLVSGAMKSGTTWLFSVLRTHPFISTTILKEIHYFARGHVPWDVLSDSDRIRKISDYFANSGPFAKSIDYNIDNALNDIDWFKKYLDGNLDIDWFINLFGNAGEDAYLSDFSPFTCLIDENRLDYILSSTNKLRILYIIRNPLERYWSHFNFHKSIFSPTDNLHDYTVSAFSSELRSSDFYQHGRYSFFIKKMKNRLNQRQYCIKSIEDIRQNPSLGIADIENFLEIPNMLYDSKILTMTVFKSRNLNMPKNFVEACLPLIKEESDEIRKLGINTPESYWDLV
jgi:hypothetical protein